ncbi:hypothetical protein I4U23_011051 [Adineta vaga]|nr:hypothetical protein I4U23_011051 [Adineta vaga]
MCAMIYHNLIDNELYEEFCGELKTHVINQCPLLFNFSELILFNHVYLLFEMNQINRDHLSISSPNYVCYNEQLCPDFPLPTINSNYSKCRLFDELGLEDREYFPELLDNINERFHTCLILPNDTHYCHHSTMYQCMNSTKCISKYRLVDGIRDCPFNDDETFNQSCSLSNVKHRFECLVNGTKTCLAPLMIEDHFSDCDNSEDEDSEDMKFLRNHITFSTICDGKEDLTPVFIDEQYETDETECEYWPCNNTYSRCDGFWLCRDGADEVNCLPSTCPEFQYNCVYPNDTTNLACLTINQIGDGFIDCLGASDERVFYRQGKSDIFWHNFKCSNEPKLINSSSFCNNKSECLFGDDEKFCTHYGYMYRYNCHYGNLSLLTEVEQFFCYNYHVFRRSPKIYFKLHSMPNYSIQSITAYDSSVSIIQEVTSSIQSNSIENIKHVDGWICNRGIGIYIRSDINQSKFYCLCPPSYYGDRCEYQNQRVSITLQVRIIYDWRIVFSFIIMLIDNDGHIESHDHIDYLSIRDCDIKFHLNLLYSSRPKNQTKNYSVRIDTFNKLTLQYRASWLFPFLFPFLPVHRLSLLLILPSHNILSHKQCTPSCIHGYCYHYINQPNLTFCRCESKWSGVRCDIANQCDCASDSVCLTDSICVCPLHRYGPRCYLRHSVCHSKSCDNNGKCIPNDERHTSTDEYQSTCICPLEYSGKQCKYRQTRIDIKFDNQIEITATLFLHFITLKDQIEPIRLSIMKKITWDQTLLTLYTSIQFNLAFAEIFNKLYLIIFQEEIIISAFITTKIRPSHRCFSIDELFNETIVNRKLLRRIKHYHIPCREQSDLMCFYDAFYLCLCDQFRRAYCFAFDHKMTYNCSGYDICENGGLCFQDDFKCPISFQCICPKCYYGSRCQFSTKESTLSLDAIIGYQIYQNTPVHRQPLVIQITMTHTRAKITEKRSYGEVLRKELNKHKSILISPCIIVILIFPRLFMSILADCMESARNPWFYLIGYLIPFIPLMSTFLIFIRPSKIYRKEYATVMQRFWKKLTNTIQ